MKILLLAFSFSFLGNIASAQYPPGYDAAAQAREAQRQRDFITQQNQEREREARRQRDLITQQNLEREREARRQRDLITQQYLEREREAKRQRDLITQQNLEREREAKRQRDFVAQQNADNARRMREEQDRLNRMHADLERQNRQEQDRITRQNADNARLARQNQDRINQIYAENTRPYPAGTTPQLLPPPAPRRPDASLAVAPRPPTAPKTSRPQLVSVGDKIAPPGAVDWAFENGHIRWIFEKEKTEVETATARAAPVPVAEVKPEDFLPKERFAPLGTWYANSPGVAAHAYLALVDEPIGIQSVEEPLTEPLKVEDSEAKEATKDRFHTVRSLLANSELPDLKALSHNAAWTGRCIFRSQPNVETGAVLGLLVEGIKVKASILTAASARELLEDPNKANPKKYDALTAGLTAEIQGQLRTVGDLGVLASVPSEERPFTKDSLFFEGRSEPNATGPGYRLRTFTSATKKKILVVEGYNPIKPGAELYGKRVDFLEPTRYCYFTQEWTF